MFLAYLFWQRKIGLFCVAILYQAPSFANLVTLCDAVIYTINPVGRSTIQSLNCFFIDCHFQVDYCSVAVLIFLLKN